MRIALPYRNPKKLEPYQEALRAVGLEPVAFQPEEALPTGWDGLLLAGGGDIDPARYGEALAPGAEPPDGKRDELEIPLALEAIESDRPLLGICRGHQLLNVALGGSLHQHIEGHRAPGEPDVHTVEVVPGSRLASILGAPRLCVNSRHHQAIARAGCGLQVTALAPDGTIEGIERPGQRFALAVQWHPEDRVRTHPPDRRLLEAFAEAVRRRSGNRS